MPAGGRLLRLRAATLADAALLMTWRNDPATRAASRNTAEVDEEEHAAWLARTLADPYRLLLVAELEGTPVGQVRLEWGGERWEISVSLAAEARGRGLSIPLIEGGVEWVEDEGGGWVEAWVRPENARSRAAFERAGFLEEPERADQEFLVLTRRV
jgi:RimJ/RimL family protein N-acetyltransferase